MAILDWPTGRAWSPSRFAFSASTPRSAWSSFFTGQQQSLSHFGDRLRIDMTLPPCTYAEAAAREAYLMQLASAGDWVRLWHMQRAIPAGTMRGSPLIAAAAANGARSITIKNALPGSSIIRNGERMNRAPWAGTPGVSTADPNIAAGANTSAITAENVADFNVTAIGYWGVFTETIAANTDVYSVSVFVLKTSGGTSNTLALFAQAGANIQQSTFNTDTGAVLGVFGPGATAVTESEDRRYWRFSITIANDGATSFYIAVAPAFDFYGLAGGNVTCTGGATCFGAQVTRGAALRTYEPQAFLAPGDVIGVGSQLLVVGYQGAQESETEIMTVPLALPLRTALALDETVLYTRPTGNFQLVGDSVGAIEYLPGRYQSAINLQFVEVY